MSKNKIQLEYIINVPVSVLYTYIATPSGLSDWFADEVNVYEDIYTFKWKNSEEKATLVASRNLTYIRFRREEDESAFEFRIIEDELTSDVSLMITDHFEDGEESDMKELWTAQVDKLRRVLGV